MKVNHLKVTPKLNGLVVREELPLYNSHLRLKQRGAEYINVVVVTNDPKRVANQFFASRFYQPELISVTLISYHRRNELLRKLSDYRTSKHSVYIDSTGDDVDPQELIKALNKYPTMYAYSTVTIY